MQVGISWLQVDFMVFQVSKWVFVFFFHGSRLVFDDSRLFHGSRVQIQIGITGGFGFSWFQVCFHGFFSVPG